MESHNLQLHGEDGDFTCNHCSFQGNSRKILLNHLEHAHKIKCHNCYEHFDSKVNLMIHRKTAHSDKINICRYFADGSCKFRNEGWYRHSENVQEIPQENPSEEQQFKCNSCGEIFTTKSNLMNHRKNTHYYTISKCREYAKGNCPRADVNCWYLHSDSSTPMDTTEGFQRVMEGTIPPEGKMVDLIRIILSKLEALEVRVK